MFRTCTNAQNDGNKICVFYKINFNAAKTSHYIIIVDMKISHSTTAKVCLAHIRQVSFSVWHLTRVPWMM